MGSNSILSALTGDIASTEQALRERDKKLVNKWSKIGLLEGLKGDHAKSNMARLLENQAKRLLTETTNMAAGDVEGYAAQSFPIVRRVFGELLANKLVSVQSLSMPTQQIYFLDVVYTNTRLGAVADTSVYGQGVVGQQITGGVDLTEANAENSTWALNNGYTSPTASAVSVTISAVTSGTFGASTALNALCRFDPDFTSGTTNVAVGEIDVSAFTGSNTPDWSNLVAFCLHTGSTFTGLTSLLTGSQVRRLTRWSGSDRTSNKLLVFLSSDSVGAINLMNYLTGTGNLKATFPIVDKFANVGTRSLGAIVGTTNWGLEDSGLMPEIDLKVDSISVTTKTKKLKYKWTPEVAQDLNAWHNMDAESELTQVASEMIGLEIDREILKDLLEEAKAGVFYWARSPGKFVHRQTGAELGASAKAPDFTGTPFMWYETLIETVNDLSAQCQRKTLKGGFTDLVCGPEVAAIFQATSGFRADVTHDENSGTVGGEKIGSVAGRKYNVHVLADFPRGLILCAKKGKGFLESGYVYAPYVPLEFSPLMYDPESGTPRKIVHTRYAKKMIKPDFYGVVVVQDMLGGEGA